MSTPPNSADADKLGSLHNLMAEQFRKLLAGELKDSEGATIYATAAELSVIRAFLKDNNVTCAPSKTNALGKLQEQLAARQRKAVVPVKPFDPETDMPDAPMQ